MVQTDYSTVGTLLYMIKLNRDGTIVGWVAEDAFVTLKGQLSMYINTLRLGKSAAREEVGGHVMEAGDALEDENMVDRQREVELERLTKEDVEF
ncbi:hypothetical protein Q3G72_021108 [Acer saccharum]|nr:hypothetical protein Q3G72_021108 [Acer saccharum]